MDLLVASERRRFESCPVNCPVLPNRIQSLSEYFAVISSTVTSEDPFWFRGHARVMWSLTPHALRFSKKAERVRALGLMSDFKRIAEIKLARSRPDDELMWAQLAQHYGLPTRLLDWTESATVGLYFACLRPAEDGMVFVLNPLDLNLLSRREARILDAQHDTSVIRQYLLQGANAVSNGKFPIAVNPVLNSERLMLQKGAFTIHGARFSLSGRDISSLVAVPILSEFKATLRSELQRVGVDEMTMFPELEHSCSHLKRRAGLAEWE